MTKKTKKIKKKGRPKTKIRKNASLLNVQEITQLLNISRSHLYTMTSTRKIPHIKLLGKKLLFDVKEINNWLQKKTVRVK